MLNITPNEILIFPQTNNGEANLKLSCNSVVPVLFKIQTTSPEKFRVRPRHGLLEPRQSININILLRSEHRLNENPKDKFLILSMPAPLDRDLSSTQSIAEIWKQKNGISPALEQSRVTCVYKSDDDGFRNSRGSNGVDRVNNVAGRISNDYGRGGNGIGRGGGNNTGRTNFDLGNGNNLARSDSFGQNDHLNELAEQTHKLEKQLKFTQFMQYFTLFILLLMSVAVVYLLRLELDFSFLVHKQSNVTSPNAAHTPGASKSLPLRTRISNSMPKMGRFGRGSK